MRRILSVIFAVMLIMLSVSVMAETTAEPVKLTVGVAWANGYTDLWGKSTVISRMMKDLNVEITLNEYDTERLNLLLASGDLDDIMCVGQTAISAVMTNHMALNLDEYLDETVYMNNETYRARNEISRALLSDNGNLYFICPRIGVEAPKGGTDLSRGYVLRWDYYKEIGAPEIHNDDDYIAALAEMKALHASTDDGREIHGMGCYDDLTCWFTRGAFLEPAMLNIWTFNATQYMSGVDDSQLYNGYTNFERSAYWNDMAFYNKLYLAGLLDPDSFTQTSADWNEKHNSGVYLGSWYRMNGLYNNEVQQNPDTLAGFIVIPSDNAVVFCDKTLLTGDAPSMVTFASAKTEHPKEVVAVLDYIHNPDYCRAVFVGVEGEGWEYDADGVPHILDNIAELRRTLGDANDTFRETSGIYPYLGGLNMLQNTFMHPDGHCIDLRQDVSSRAASLTDLQKDYCEFYGVEYPSQASLKHVESGEAVNLSGDYGQLVSMGASSVPLDVSRIVTKCNDILYRALPRLVMAEDAETFEAVRAQVLADLENAGEATAWEWYLDAYNASREIVSPIFEAAR